MMINIIMKEKCIKMHIYVRVINREKERERSKTERKGKKEMKRKNG